jgi:hypothetical protein
VSEEISPDRGNHAARIRGRPPAVSTRFRRRSWTLHGDISANARTPLVTCSAAQHGVGRRAAVACQAGRGSGSPSVTEGAGGRRDVRLRRVLALGQDGRPGGSRASSECVLKIAGLLPGLPHLPNGVHCPARIVMRYSACSLATLTAGGGPTIGNSASSFVSAGAPIAESVRGHVWAAFKGPSSDQLDQRSRTAATTLAS